MKLTSNSGHNQQAGLAPDDLALRERIAKRAYYLWLANGSRHGEHLRYWLEAETEEMKATRQGQEQPSTLRPARQTGKSRSTTVSHNAVHGK
jgi:hypothetical protein